MESILGWDIPTKDLGRPPIIIIMIIIGLVNFIFPFKFIFCCERCIRFIMRKKTKKKRKEQIELR